jgi:hypothetical protein
MALMAALGVAVLCAWVRRQDIERLRCFNERFPPISDAEFVARCSPNVNPQLALRVRRIVADNLGVSYDRIYPSTSFADDIGADGWEVLGLIDSSRNAIPERTS